MKYEYICNNFKEFETIEIENWTNKKGYQGYKIINIHNFELKDLKYLRIAMERENK